MLPSPIEVTATLANSERLIVSSGLKAPLSASPTMISSAPKTSIASAYFESTASLGSAANAVAPKPNAIHAESINEVNFFALNIKIPP